MDQMNAWVSKPPTSLILSGFCPQTLQPRIATFNGKRYPHPDGNVSHRANFVEKQAGDFAYIGDKQLEIRELVEARRNAVALYSLPWWRAPWGAIYEAAHEPFFLTIGGPLMVGISSRVQALPTALGGNFSVHWSIFSKADKPTFLDLSALQNGLFQVGPTFSVLPGISYEV